MPARDQLQNSAHITTTRSNRIADEPRRLFRRAKSSESARPRFSSSAFLACTIRKVFGGARGVDLPSSGDLRHLRAEHGVRVLARREGIHRPGETYNRKTLLPFPIRPSDGCIGARVRVPLFLSERTSNMRRNHIYKNPDFRSLLTYVQSRYRRDRLRVSFALFPHAIRERLSFVCVLT